MDHRIWCWRALLGWLMALAIGSPADAGMNRMVMARDLPLEQAMQGSAAHADTVWFGGSGSGNGSVVRGGIWNWEADSGEIACPRCQSQPNG